MNPLSPARLNLWKIFPLLLAVFPLVSCPSPGYTGGDENEILPQSISIVGNNALPKNGITYLTAIVKPADADNKTVLWSSSDKNAVSVNYYGKITVSDSAQVGSEVTITASSAAGEAKEIFLIRITSDYVAAAGVNLFPPRLYLPQGGTGILAAQILPENASDQSISWSVDHEEIELTTQGLELHVAVPDNLAPGEYTVTAGRDHLAASAVIEVLPVEEEEYTAVTDTAIHFEGNAVTSVDVVNGGSYKFTANIMPLEATIQEVSWSSSHPSFVTVDSSGFVTVAEDVPPDMVVVITIRSLAGGQSSQVTLKTPSLRIYHVMPQSSGTGDGSSWDNATDSLQAAMNNAEGGSAEIWVAAGTYVPAGSPHGVELIAIGGTTLPVLPSETLYYFALRSGVQIYGGFAGTETDRSQRDLEANITIFSGDREGNDVHNPAVLPANDPISNTEDNVHHVFFNPYYFKGEEALGEVIRDVVIDGVVIQGGAARTAASEDSANLLFDTATTNYYSTHVQGAGLHLSGLRVSQNKLDPEDYSLHRKLLEEKRASITLRNVTFQRNKSGDNLEMRTTGTALFFQNVDAVLENVDFKQNYLLGRVQEIDDNISLGGGTFAASHSKISYTTGIFEENIASNRFPANKGVSSPGIVLYGSGTGARLDGLVFRNNQTASESVNYSYELLVGGVDENDFVVVKNSIFHDFAGGDGGGYTIGFAPDFDGKVFLVNSIFYRIENHSREVESAHSMPKIYLINSLVSEKTGTESFSSEGLVIINSIIDMDNTFLNTPVTGPIFNTHNLLRIGHSILNINGGKIRYPLLDFPEPLEAPGPPYFSQLWFEAPAFKDKSNPPGLDGIFGTIDDGFRLTPAPDRKGLFVRVSDYGEVFYSADKIRWYDEPGLTNQVPPSGEILNERDFNGDLWEGQPGIGYVKP